MSFNARSTYLLLRLPAGIFSGTPFWMRSWLLRAGVYWDHFAIFAHLEEVTFAFHSIEQSGDEYALPHIKCNAVVLLPEPGYQNVPAIATYLSNPGLRYYRFEVWDKALWYFLAAEAHTYYLPRAKINPITAIGLIYVHRGAWDSAISLYRKRSALPDNTVIQHGQVQHPATSEILTRQDARMIQRLFTLHGITSSTKPQRCGKMPPNRHLLLRC